MFTHPDLLGSQVKQHMDEMMAQAEQERVLTAALRRRREARAAARAASRTARSSPQTTGRQTVRAPQPVA